MNADLRNPLRLDLLLEEGVRLRLRPAGLATRLVARMIDALCQVVLAGAFLLLPGTLAERMVVETQAAATARVTLLALAALGTLASASLYPLFFELIWTGRTPGKRLMGIAVTDMQGRTPTIAMLVMRNLLRVVDLMPAFGLLGLTVAAFDQVHRRVGDLVAGTLVVEQRAGGAQEPATRRWTPG